MNVQEDMKPCLIEYIVSVEESKQIRDYLDASIYYNYMISEIVDKRTDKLKFYLFKIVGYQEVLMDNYDRDVRLHYLNDLFKNINKLTIQKSTFYKVGWVPEIGF